MRPRFEFAASCPPDEAAQRLRAALARPDAWCQGSVFRGHAVLHVPDAEQHVWSPFLTLDFDWQDGGTRVRGRYGPKPSIWSLFIAAYTICGCLALFALVFGWSQSSIGQTPWAYGGAPATALCAIATYGFARWGQHLGREQMEALRDFTDRALGIDV